MRHLRAGSSVNAASYRTLFMGESVSSRESNCRAFIGRSNSLNRSVPRRTVLTFRLFSFVEMTRPWKEFSKFYRAARDSFVLSARDINLRVLETRLERSSGAKKSKIQKLFYNTVDPCFYERSRQTRCCSTKTSIPLFHLISGKISFFSLLEKSNWESNFPGF